MTPTAKTFRLVAALEATSFLALLVATYVKYQHDSEIGVQILGPIHGLLFLGFVWLALQVRGEAGWDNRTTFWVLVGAVVPFGGYAVERWLLRERTASS